MKLYVKIALGVVFLIAVTSILAALYLYNKKSPNLATLKPDYIITSAALQKSFEENEKMASEKYINKIIEVTGKINSISPPQNNIISLSLSTENDLSSINCTFAPATDPEAINLGNTITIRGECSGFLADVLMKNCVIIDK
jgi:hypothetical protein